MQTLLLEIKTLLEPLLGKNLLKVVLFGSQITENARNDSDYDILIVVQNPFDYRLKRQILNYCYQICLQRDILLDVKIISQYELDHSLKGKLPIYTQALQNGISV